MTRIVIADDHAIVREGLKRIVGEAGDLEVVDEACDGTDAIRAVSESCSGVRTNSSWE